MDRRFGLHGKRGSQIASWITLIYLYSTLCVWTRVEGWSYFYSNTTMNWNDARDWCKTMNNSDMVAIQNQEEIAHLNSWLPKKNGYYWIGIRKINDNWTWVGTNKTLTEEATNWADKEPNNGKKNGKTPSRKPAVPEDCVEMYIKRDKEQGKWNDESCAKLKTALCFTAACKKDLCVPQHGECVETINNHTCSCYEGFYGDRCEHVVQCDKEEVTVHAKASVSCSHVHGQYAYDSLCQYSCQEGYSMSTPDRMKCNASGKWSEQPPTCELVQCKELSAPDRGFMNCSNPLGSSSYQSTRTFSCEEGYILAGSDHLQCQSSGLWNDSRPQCAAVMCQFLEHPENGAVNCGHDDNVEMRFSYENSCNFTCDQGYRLVGANTVTCMSTKEWSENEPRCEAITCQRPEGDAPLLVECSNATNQLTPDATCNFSCGAGFELQGAPSIQCSEEGQWTTDIPTCKALQCTTPMAPEGVQIACVPPPSPSSSVSAAADSHPQGSVCTFSCDEGHELQGSLNMECTQTGHWNSTPPTCTVVQCKELTVPDKGSMKCSGPLGTSSYQATCTFSCEDGYQLSTPGHIKCSESGKWSEEQTPTCELVQCKELSAPDRGSMKCSGPLGSSSYQSTCTFSCEEGYILAGSDHLQCQSSGLWNDSRPQCVALQCPAPVVPEGVQVTCVAPSPSSSADSHPQGSVCTFSCDEGHELQGSLNVECTQTGRWNSTPPTCTVVTCDSLEDPANGAVSCSDSEPIYNTQCNFTCDQGHSLHGQEALACNRHGNWTAEMPTCLRSGPTVNPTTLGLAAGGAALLSGLSLAAWLLKRLRLRKNKFELNSFENLLDAPQHYRNSIDSDILI